MANTATTAATASTEKDVPVSQVSFIEAYGKTAFMKIKSALEMDDRKEQYGKMIFSFVNAKNSKEFVDIYMDVNDFNIFMEDIHSGRMSELVKTKPWTSNYGGKIENGQPISRYFTVGASSVAGSLYFNALKLPAEVTSTGAYKPKSGAKELVKLSVPVPIKEFDRMYMAWAKLYQKYLDRYITLDRYRNNYTYSKEN